ncbi:MAG: carbohydrate binding domain-containing protein, partial [Planctomycetaceae bacterium]|nr:carbohydrate binding domain-containing protein [Planctomycetaceae bacterium]
IIHRDLKPANIMLGNYGETLVVDWGLAKQVGVETQYPMDIRESRILSDSDSGSAPTQFGRAVGTPQYMSPEQATGRIDRMGPLTDVFGLGATLYHLLTNQPPQREDSLEQILERVEHGDFPKLSDINPTIPRPLEAICLKALALRPSERYANPTELGSDIERWLADEPVDVCRDSLMVRTTRWIRKNQTLAATTAVASLLLIAGGFVWKEIQHNRQQRETEIQQADMARLARLRDSLDATNRIVRQQIDNGQFATAVSVLNSKIEALESDHEFPTEREQLSARAARLSRIHQSQQLALSAQKANYLALDQDEIIATVNSLNLLGVWDHADWWNHLPIEDLNATQQDQLRQTVYRTLVLLASTYTKLTGDRTLAATGGRIPPSLRGKLGVIFGKEGKQEARATLRICDMASRFQFAESLAWYRGVAAFRLLKGRMIPVSRLKQPRNSADAYELGIMTVTRAVVKDFPFTRYRGVQDDLMSARETMGIASEMSPEHYFTHLVLAQCQYLTADAAVTAKDPEAWQLYDTSRQTFGRCISLQPDLPFAYADLSTVCLREYEVIANSKALSQVDIERMQRDLRDSCLKFALQAVRLGPNEGWVYWHYGHALAATGRIDDAMKTYAQAIELSFRFRDDSNASLVNTDNIRGLDRIISDTTQRINDGDNRSIINAVLAGAFIKQGKYEEARPFAVTACQGDEVDSFAWVVRGQLALHDGQSDLAVKCFETRAAQDAESSWAAIGLGLSYEQLLLLPNAKTWFQRARGLTKTDYHAATAELGLCRVQMRMGDNTAAAASVLNARALYPACILDEIKTLAEELNATPVQAAIESSRQISVQDIVENEAILSATDIPVHNGDFELPLDQYWNNPGAATWQVQGDGRSTAQIDHQITHTGNGSLHIQTRNNPRAMTRQTITVEQDSVYQVFLWVKSEASSPDCISIAVVEEDSQPVTKVITIPAGQYDWTQVSGTFETPTFPRGEPLAPMSLYLISTGACDIWADDIQITRIRDRETKETASR